jgi:5-methylthioadenosine/S-adenosylhomocysteine deaminase
MTETDTLLNSRWIVPVEPEGLVLEDHSVAILGGRIQDLLPARQAREIYRAHTVIELDEHVLIPGLVNTHTHAAMSLLRGVADDLPLMQWLERYIWPAERRWVSEDFVHDGTQLAVAEMLRGGVTCFNDMYFFPEATARVAAVAGIRATVGLIVIDFPSAWAGHAEEYLDKGLEVHDSVRSETLIRAAFAPHSPYTVGDTLLARIGVLADELDIPIHMHVHETAHEVKQSLQTHGQRPLARLQRLQLLSPSLLAVHMTQLLDPEIETFAAAGGHVVHCPESNLKLASGFCHVARLVQAGVNVALGTDGAASNNNLDMFEEMRTAALLAKGVAESAAASPASYTLRQATLNGARALGLGEETGSLVIGKAADLVAVYLGAVEDQPVYNPVSHLVYASGRDKVTDVWVAGRHLVKDGSLTTLDTQALIAKAVHWRERICSGLPSR